MDVQHVGQIVKFSRIVRLHHFGLGLVNIISELVVSTLYWQNSASVYFTSRLCKVPIHSSVCWVTYRPAMYHDEGLRRCVEFTLFDGFRPAGKDVAHVVIGDVRCAQGELGHNVSEVCDPFSSGRQGSSGDCGVYCCNTHTNKQTNKEIDH